MTILSVGDMIEVTNAKIYLPEGTRLPGNVDRVVIDTRQIDAAALFIALKGKHVDGHDFLLDALKSGAKLAMVESEQPIAIPQLVVSSCEAAIRLLALATRGAFKGKVIAITGSCGKTSTKEMLVAILGQEHHVSFTLGNQNNELGLPLTLMNISQNSDFAIVEMGACKPLDIKNLMAFAVPDVAVVTNVGVAHIGIFGNQQRIAETKSEVYLYLKKSGFAILNYDDKYFDFLFDRCKKIQQTLTFSLLNTAADLYASDLSLQSNKSDFSLHYRGESQPCTISVPGEHAVMNSICALACAIAVGVDNLSVIAKGLSLVGTMKGRSCEYEGSWDGLLIDDTYNANPISMKAAVNVLSLQAGRRILVLGDMGELGERSDEFHREILHYAIEQNIDKIFVTGPLMISAAVKLNADIKIFLNKEDLLQALKKVLQPHDVVLLKGSRYLKMESLIEPLVKKDNMSCC